MADIFIQSDGPLIKGKRAAIVCFWIYQDEFDDGDIPDDDWLFCLVCLEKIIHFKEIRVKEERVEVEVLEHFEAEHGGVLAFLQLQKCSLESTMSIDKLAETGRDEIFTCGFRKVSV